MAPYLTPVEKPRGFMLRMGYWYTKRQFGQVPGPLSVFCARLPSAFTSFYGKVGKLDGKLTLPKELAMLVREQVARTNGCEFCIDSNRWAALNKGGLRPEKLDALHDFATSAQFSSAERAALAFVTEVASTKHSSPETFKRLGEHFSEQQICELVWLLASEHLYNINNVALNIGAQGMCAVAQQPVSAAA